tara:strand:+ start:1854 stop:2402 length:549 start_codon:yes stop_codon:yes gene_type:complete
MYTLYTDKNENFQCAIDVEGANLSETKARLILDSDKVNLLYEGTIDSSGTCTIPINKLKNLLAEGTKGTMKLEVIAEDTFFSPWEDDFVVDTNKRVTVEVLSSKQTPIKENKISVKINSVKENTKNTHSLRISKLLEMKGINKNNIEEKLDEAAVLVERYTKKFKINQSNSLLTEVITNLIK